MSAGGVLLVALALGGIAGASACTGSSGQRTGPPVGTETTVPVHVTGTWKPPQQPPPQQCAGSGNGGGSWGAKRSSNSGSWGSGTSSSGGTSCTPPTPPPTTTPSQSWITGHIYLCSNGAPTTSEVSGGTLSVATGPGATIIGPTANPLQPAAVGAGNYLMSATAPAGYAFVACGGSDTIASPPTSATSQVTVPKCHTGTGLFYVTAASAPSSISLSITKTNDADGSGTYAQTETAQTPGENVPFQVVVTNDSPVAVTVTSLTDSWPGQAAFSPTCASAVVNTTMQPGGSATCDFTEDGYAPAAGGSVTNTVVVTGCQQGTSSNCGNASATSTVQSPPVTATRAISLAVTKTNDADGSGTYAQTETAESPGENVPFQVVVTNDSLVAVTISSLSDAWPGQAPFSPTCASAMVNTTLQPGESATCDFTAAGYAPAAGGSAVTDTVVVDGCQLGNDADCGSWQSSSTVEPAPITSTPLANAVLPATTTSSGKLAFTGPPAKLHLMLVAGLAMASAGFFVLWFARPRRKVAARS